VDLRELGTGSTVAATPNGAASTILAPHTPGSNSPDHPLESLFVNVDVTMNTADDVTTGQTNDRAGNASSSASKLDRKLTINILQTVYTMTATAVTYIPSARNCSIIHTHP
jgi:hypothetical protein